jgi:phage tail-like protein
VAEEQLRGTVNAAFRYVVSVDGEGQAAFTECTLPTVAWEVQEVKEGGLNTFVHQLPGQRRPGQLQLKNGVGQSTILDWYLASMEGAPERKAVTVALLDAEKQTVLTWHLKDAFPSNWQGPQLTSDARTVAIQTLELVCGEITVAYE